MQRRSKFWLVIGALSLAATAAPAQDFMAPAPKPSRRVKLDSVCSASLERYCPALAETPGQTRNQVICLKPYRSSLPTSCRSAVTAALR